MSISHADLEMLVAEHLNLWVAARRQFTAFDMTRALRAHHPGVNIMHHLVRGIVHRRMEPAVAGQFYEPRAAMFPTGIACCYVPIA
jgi:hypothetical protein